jgi:hypothetical protein
VGSHPAADHDPRALDNVWQIRLSYLRLSPLSDRSSGRIFSLSFCPGSHRFRGRWQGTRLTRFHHGFYRIDYPELCHNLSDWSIDMVVIAESWQDQDHRMSDQWIKKRNRHMTGSFS